MNPAGPTMPRAARRRCPPSMVEKLGEDGLPQLVEGGAQVGGQVLQVGHGPAVTHQSDREVPAFVAEDGDVEGVALDDGPERIQPLHRDAGQVQLLRWPGDVETTTFPPSRSRTTSRSFPSVRPMRAAA